jgi:hypothetical protein
MKILQKMGEKLPKRYRGGSFFFVLQDNPSAPTSANLAKIHNYGPTRNSQ